MYKKDWVKATMVYRIQYKNAKIFAFIVFTLAGMEGKEAPDQAPRGRALSESSSGSDHESPEAAGEKVPQWDENLKKMSALLDTESGEEAESQDEDTSQEAMEAEDSLIPHQKPLLDEEELGAREKTCLPWAGRFQRPATSAYDDIRSARVLVYSAPSTTGKEEKVEILENFRNLGDSRHTVVKEVSNQAKGLNISFSFDPVSLTCFACAQPHVVGLLGDQTKPTFIISDQCMPPLAPPTGPGGCIAFMRVEDGSLEEIANCFIETVGAKNLPRGTMVAISAGGHLARVGVAQYAADSVEAINRIKRALAPASFVAHGPLLFACGINDPGIVRAVADICNW